MEDRENGGRRGKRILTDILSYDSDRDVWLTYSHMKLPRSSHSVSAVTVSQDIMAQCRQSRSPADDSLYGAQLIIVS